MYSVNSEFLEVEKPFIEQLTSTGWNYQNGKELQRNQPTDILLKDILQKKIIEINPWINEENISSIFRKLSLIETNTLL